MLGRFTTPYMGRLVARTITSASVPQYRLAICGAGAAGLSTLKALRKRWLEKNLDAQLHADVFEASIVPLGLIRLGVAPDHASTKAIGDQLLKTIDSWQMDKDKRFTFAFYGGVEVGRAFTLPALRAVYDSVILTTGSYAPGDTSSPALEVENEFAPGIINSKEFVAFYNGSSLHPPENLYQIYKQVPGTMEEIGQWVMDPELLDYSLARSYSLTSVGQDREPRTTRFQMGSFLDLTHPADRVVVIGQGNVSTDVARMLMLDPEALPGYHMSAAAKEALRCLHKKFVRDVVIMGRRGALQASWDTATLRELTKIAEDVKVVVNPNELVDSLTHPLAIRAVRRDRAAKRMINFLEQCATDWELEEAARDNGEQTNRTITLKFLSAPKRFLVDPQNQGAVHAVEVKRNRLDPECLKKETCELDAIEDSQAPTELIDRVRLVVKSIGYGCAGAYSRSRWMTRDTNPKPCKTFVFPRPWRDNNSFKVEDAIPGKSASLFGAGWFQSNGRGSLGNSVASGSRVAEHVLTDILARDPCGHAAAGSRLTLSTTVPEVGIPVSWEEARNILAHEQLRDQKIVTWSEAVDFVNRARAKEGPRGLNWMREDMGSHPNKSAFEPHLVEH